MLPIIHHGLVTSAVQLLLAENCGLIREESKRNHSQSIYAPAEATGEYQSESCLADSRAAARDYLVRVFTYAKDALEDDEKKEEPNDGEDDP